MEIEALESILMDDLEELTDTPHGWKPTNKVYRVEIVPQLEDDQRKDYPVMAEVVFSHTPNYPDEPPLMKARSLRGMSDADLAILQSVLDGQVEENLGMPMVYQLITAAQEWITEKGTEMAQPVLDPLAEEKKKRAAEEERIAELRRHGTPCTVETFKAWKEKFDAEMALAKSSIQDSTTAGAVKGKMTGRAWFLQQEAQHIEIEEPELSDEEHEEDGEGSRSDWSGEDRTDYFGKQLIEGSSEDDEDVLDVDDDDDEDFLDAYLTTEGGDGEK
ncbi:hypothetical protein KSW81_006624 [Nannochloris sp. 'desiccata']|nr:hypothetical protein KSW81_006624 [Chlorella desiccata (nom. nud.)]